MPNNTVTNSESDRWKRSSDSFKEAAEYLANTIITSASEYAKNESLWCEAAAKAKESAEHYQEAAQALASKNENEDSRLTKTANLLLAQAHGSKYKAKAKEEEINGNRELVIKWNEIERLNQESFEPYFKATKANAAGKTEEDWNWNGVGNGFAFAANNLSKAIEAEAAGKPAEALKWSEAAGPYQQSVEPYIQAARAKSEGKIDEEASWNMAGMVFYWGAEKLGKAIEAEAAGQPAEASKWREAAGLQQQSVEPYTKAAEARAAGKTDEGNSWHQAGNAFYWRADKLGKAIEAEAAGKPAEAQKWKEAAALYQQSVEPFTQAARAHAVGKTDEAKSWYKAGHGFYYVADKLGKAIEAEAAGKPAEAAKWREAAGLQQQSVEPYIQAAREGAASTIQKAQETWHALKRERAALLAERNFIQTTWDRCSSVYAAARCDFSLEGGDDKPMLKSAMFTGIRIAAAFSSTVAKGLREDEEISSKKVSAASDAASADSLLITSSVTVVRNMLRSYAAAQQSVAIDAQLITSLGSKWSTTLTLFEKEKNDWVKITSHLTTWKDHPIAWNNIAEESAKSLAACKKRNFSKMEKYANLVDTAIDNLEAAKNLDAFKKIFEEAQQATQAADQAFVVLEEAREKAFQEIGITTALTSSSSSAASAALNLPSNPSSSSSSSLTSSAARK